MYFYKPKANFPALYVQLALKVFFFLGCAGLHVRREKRICFKQENVMVKPVRRATGSKGGAEPEITFKSFQRCIDFQSTEYLSREGFNLTMLLTTS